MKEYIRSTDLNNYYRSVLRDLSGFLSLYKVYMSVDEIHKINKRENNIDTTTKMKTLEFMNFVDKVIIYWQQKTNYKWIPK